MKKRILAMLLVLVMTVSMLPLQSLAVLEDIPVATRKSTASESTEETTACSTEGCTYGAGHEGNCSNYVEPTEACATEGCTYGAGHEGNCSNYVAPTEPCSTEGCTYGAGHEGLCSNAVAPMADVEPVTVTVSFTAQAGGAFMAPPQLAMAVSSDTAENYGYTDMTDQETQVSALDVLVAAHVVKYGDAFTMDTSRNYLVADNNFITRMFASDNGGNVCMLVNGVQPGSNGVAQAVVSTGDLIEFFVYQDTTSWSDQYVWLTLSDGTKVNGQTVYAGSTVNVVVKGYSVFSSWNGYTESNIAGATIYLVNVSTGALTSMGVTTGEDGTATITVPKAYAGQTLYLTAKGDNMAMTLAKVTVEAAPVSEDCNLTSLEIAVGSKTEYTSHALSPDFSSDVTAYSTATLDYIGSTSKNYVWIKAEAPEGATITAENGKSGVTAITSGEWTYLEYVYSTFFGGTSYYGTLSDGTYNEVTITVTAADGSTKDYIVTIPVEVDLSKSKLEWTTDLASSVYFTKDDTSPNPLSVEAKYTNRPLADTNEITYQWYSNTTASTEGSTAIAGATAATYTPSVTDLGKSYYYVVATCGEKTLTSTVTEVNVTEQTAPTALTITCDWPYTVADTWTKALGGVDYVVKAGDVLNLKVVDENGNETPVTWVASSCYGGTLDTATGQYTVASNSYSYVQAVSLFDSSVKSEEQVIIAKFYTISDTSVTLATDGQSFNTVSASNSLGGYNVWTYQLSEENIAQLNSDLTTKPANIQFSAMRPGTIEVSVNLDMDGDGVGDGNQTATATLTINGIAVEDANGDLTKTYLEISSDNPNPTMQLTALSSVADDTITWSSADETIATVDENGVVTAQSVGSVIISAKGNSYTGGIKVVVTHGEIPYFEVLDFTTAWSGAVSSSSWKTANFKPTTLEYTGLKMANASSSTMTLKNTTTYNTDKYTAVATYTDENGEAQSVEINSGAATALAGIPFGTSTVTITLTDKTDDTVKTVYTFEVTRPRDTVKNIANSGIVFVPDGRDIWKDQYDSKTEGVMYVANVDGSFAQYSGVSAARYYYRTYAMNALEAFTLTLKGSSAYTHIRYSTDDGETWTYLGQTGSSGVVTGKITFPEAEEDANPVAKVMIQILDDSTYSANVAEGNDGFADATPNTYTVWVEQIPVISAECDIVTAETDHGDWYPTFASDRTSYRIMVAPEAEAPVLTFTVSEDATVTIGDEVQTPGENGEYTLTLTETSQSILVAASDGMTNKTYSFGYSERASIYYPDKVVDYLSVNSQYINGGGGGYGTNPQQTLTDSGLLSLGNFGGYVTFYLANGLTDNPNNTYGVDFYVNGNAFKDTSTGTGLGSMEPGQVWVSEDGATWYALAGSEHYEASTIWNYSVTYTKTETGGTDWSDNYGNTMSSTHGRAFAWPSAEVYTMNDYATRDSFTLTGILIPCVDGTITGTDNFGSYSKGGKFGYVDMLPNGTANPYLENSGYTNASSGFDLAWAVDGAGNPVDVSGMTFHYVKVVTASNIIAGSANEKSTEVANLTVAASTGSAVGVTDAPTGVTFTSGETTYTMNFEDGKQIYEVTVPSGMENATILVNGTADSDNIYINNQWVASNTASREYSFSTDSQRLVRIIVQNGEKEPVIYLLKIKEKVTYGLSELELYKDASAYNNGEAPLTITPEFDGSVRTGYTASAPDYNNSVYMVAALDENSRDYEGFVYVTNNWGGWSGTWVSDGVLKASAVYTNKGYAGAYFDDRTLEYQVVITPYATLKGLTIDGVADQEFNRDVTAYHVYADSTAEGISITPTGYKSAYTITINGTEVTNGGSYTLPYSWDDQDKMQVTIEISGTGVASSIYTVELEKMPMNDDPYIVKESGEADYTVIDTASYVQDLFVIASANGDLTYQWYYNSTASTEGGTLIEGATESTYTPPITEDVIGTRYYYCQITNDGAEEGNVTFSTPTRVTVDPNPTPVAIITNPGMELSDEYEWNVGYVYTVDAETTGLTVEATTAVDGELTYQWRNVGKAYNYNGWSSVSNESTSSTYYPLTTRKMAADTGKYYCCYVTCTFKGRTYTTKAVTGATYTEGEGDSANTYNVDAVYVYITVDEAAVPTFTVQPKDASYFVGDKMTGLSVTATRDDAGKLTYQWYVNDECTTEGSTAIEGATNRSYALGTAEEKGTKYYYCVVTNTIQGYTATATSEIAQISITVHEVSISDKLTGSGTAEDPYQIWDAQDYQDVYDLVAEGESFEGLYLKQMADITLPDNWQPIGSDTANRFSGTLDGNNKTLTIPEDGLPLLGYVAGAEVKDLNIYGKKIAGYGLVNHLEGVGLSGEAICIDNVTLKSGSSTLKSGLIGTYLTTNGFAGCSAAFYVTIKNCTIEEGVIIGYNKDQSMIGSIAGRVHGTIENCVSYATVYGTDYVGGIIGTRDNAMGTCTVTGCNFYGTVVATGEHVGGIVGGGYQNSTAPNGYKVNVSDCTVTGSITGADKVGGIVGGDTYVAQLWGTHTLKNNSFTGTVKATDGTYVGGIIGYYLSLNKYDDISGNYYSSNCGADNGICFVRYIDTNCTTHETASGATYFSTETNTDECPNTTGCNWRTAHNRTDDPLGADAAKLCYTDTQTEPVATELKVSGTYKTEYVLGDTLDLSGIVLTVVYNTGDTETIALKDVTVTGFDPDEVGDQTLTISYNGLSVDITVKVENPTSEIKVTVSVYGDSVHNSNSDGKVHTLSGGGLTAWVGAKTYTVDSDSTVWDVLQTVFAENGITCSYRNSLGTVYISSLTRGGVTLGEFTNGTNSGWMYTLNGTHPLNGVAQQYLKDGDVIVFHYTDDYTKEEGSQNNDDDDDSELVENAEKLIDAIGTVTLDSEDEISAARKAYDALTYAQKQQVENYAKLTDAEAKFAELKKAADEKAAEEVEALINRIDKASTSYEYDIRIARAAYNSLTADQKKLVDNYYKLIQAEKDLADEEDKEAAEAVEKLIDAIGTVTLDSEKDIAAAREAYEKLTDEQKDLVENLDALEAAEAKLAELKVLAGIEDIYITTGDYIENLGTPTTGSVGGEWMVIGLARSGREINGVEDYYASVVQYIQENIDENERLHSAKSTDNSRIILALTALGYDVTNVDGHNLLNGLNEMAFIQKQGLNGPIWALIAFDSGNYPTPKGDVSREALIQVILDAQLDDGGWALSGTVSDADMTGMALQALAPYYNTNAEVKEAIDKALDTLSLMQNADGSFSTYGGDSSMVATSESIAQVIAALSALGIDAHTDARFIKNGVSAVDALCAFYVNGGGFRHLLDGALDGMATEQGYYALVAYFRMLDDETALYNMTDVIDMGGDPVEEPVEGLTEVTEPVTEPAPAQDKGGSFPWWIIIVVLGAGAVIVVIVNRKKIFANVK